MTAAMPSAPIGDLVRQHLIDPAVCFRCDACESSCPKGAISHADNYVVDPNLCDACGDCVASCPSGAADNWRLVPRDAIYAVDAQLAWVELPADAGGGPGPTEHVLRHTLPPTGAAPPRNHLFDLHRPALATLASSELVAGTAEENEVRHLVLRFDTTPFPVLEGQTLGILPPGLDHNGHRYFARAYSVASARDGESPGRNDIALTVKRVSCDRDGKRVRGITSNYLCDLQPGATVQVVGPFGDSFLMPGPESTRLFMICTGTGIAPMRSMIQRRARASLATANGTLRLLYGGRSRSDMAYLRELEALPRDLLDLRLALSRQPGEERRYVQDLLRADAEGTLAWLTDGETCLYLCGLRGMEDGVFEALTAICGTRGLDWPDLAGRLRREGRLHIETY